MSDSTSSETKHTIRTGYLDQVFNDLTVYANELKVAFITKFPERHLVCVGDPNGDDPELPDLTRFTDATYDETSGEPYHARPLLYGAYHDGNKIYLVDYLWDAPWRPNDSFPLEMQSVTLDYCEVLEELLRAELVPLDNLRTKAFRKTYNLKRSSA